ncbi:hypothetical protein R0J90_08270 [Micrococcus sp. SIMBA_144]
MPAIRWTPTAPCDLRGLTHDAGPRVRWPRPVAPPPRGGGGGPSSCPRGDAGAEVRDTAAGIKDGLAKDR